MPRAGRRHACRILYASREPCGSPGSAKRRGITSVATEKKPARVRIPKDVSARVLVASAHTCCVCHNPDRRTQIHHIDDDRTNNDPANLAVLCMPCHDKTQVSGGFGRKLSAEDVRQSRDEWLDLVKE